MDANELILAGDKKLFRQLSNMKHRLHPFLPKHRNSKISNFLRNRKPNYELCVTTHE